MGPAKGGRFRPSSQSVGDLGRHGRCLSTFCVPSAIGSPGWASAAAGERPVPFSLDEDIALFGWSPPAAPRKGGGGHASRRCTDAVPLLSSPPVGSSQSGARTPRAPRRAGPLKTRDGEDRR